MSNVQVTDCGQPAATKLARVNFFNRQLLTADDMTTDRDYFLQKLRRHNRFLHGWGVVCGLPVSAAPISGTPWRVQVGSGYALGPYGDEIFLGEAVYFDLAACISGGSTSPCEPNMVTSGGAGTSATAYLAIRYAECLARPVQTASSGCGCDSDCQYSRILDSFQIQCLAQLPPTPATPPTLCQVVRGGTIAPCPPCPTEPWVVLAKIVLPSAATMNISNSRIDNVSVRRVILSTAVLQDQIVRCCCGPASSSSSSSSSPVFTQQPPQPKTAVRNTAAPAVLNIAQRATKIAGAAEGATQIAVTLMNSGAQAAENVVLSVALSPALAADAYTLTATGWQSATLAELKSAPVTLPPGKAQTLSFQIAPVKKSEAVTVTSTASAAGPDATLSATAIPLQATIGG